MFYLDDQGWHVEVSSSQFRKGCVWTIRSGMWKLAPDGFVKVFLDDPGWHVEFGSGRFRKGLIGTIRGSLWSFVSDDFVKR